VELDAAAGESLLGDLPQDRTQAVVRVERGLRRHRHLAFEPRQRDDPLLPCGPLAQRALELGRLQPARAPGQADQQRQGGRDEEQRPDVEREPPVARREGERDGEPEGRGERDRSACERSSHEYACNSSRMATSASIASSFISGPTSWWLNFARSKRAVSLDTDAALARRRSRSTRDRYSRGASAGRRGTPHAASARSMRA